MTRDQAINKIVKLLGPLPPMKESVLLVSQKQYKELKKCRTPKTSKKK